MTQDYRQLNLFEFYNKYAFSHSTKVTFFLKSKIAFKIDTGTIDFHNQIKGRLFDIRITREDMGVSGDTNLKGII